MPTPTAHVDRAMELTRSFRMSETGGDLVQRRPVVSGIVDDYYRLAFKIISSLQHNEIESISQSSGQLSVIMRLEVAVQDFVVDRLVHDSVVLHSRQWCVPPERFQMFFRRDFLLFFDQPCEVDRTILIGCIGLWLAIYPRPFPLASSWPTGTDSPEIG